MLMLSAGWDFPTPMLRNLDPTTFTQTSEVALAGIEAESFYDLTTADGDLVPNGPRMTPVDEATRLTGMPGGPYEACFMDDGEEG